VREALSARARAGLEATEALALALQSLPEPAHAPASPSFAGAEPHPVRAW
jgi:hypothetical protein